MNVKMNKKTQFVCKTCGNISGGENQPNSMSFQFSLEESARHYCLKCLEKWISKNVTQLTIIE